MGLRVFKHRHFTPIAMAVVFFIFFLPFAVISFCNQPTLDDYWNANEIHEYGRLGAPVAFYNSVSGRYFSLFMMSVCNTLPDKNVWLFKLAPIIFPVLLGCAFCFFSRAIVKNIASKKIVVYASVIAVALQIVNMRSMYECLFWTSAAFVYQLTAIVFLFATGCIFSYMEYKKTSACIMAVLLSFLLAGTAESIIPFYFVILLLLLYHAYKNKSNWQFIALCLTALLAGTIIVLLSPGSYKRVAYDAGFYHQDVFFAGYQSVITMGYYTLLWMINPVNIAALFIMLPFLLKANDSIVKCLPSLIKNANIFLLSAGCFLLTASIYFPLYYFETSIPFPRVTTLVFVPWLLCFLLLCSVYINRNQWLHQRIQALIRINNYALYCCVVFAISLFTSVNFTDVSKDILNGSAFVYNRESFERYNQIRNCTQDTCYLEPYTGWPASILSTMQENTSSENFMHMDEYFGKRLILKKK